MRQEVRLLKEILEEGGILSKVVASYEWRPQQLEMGQLVLESLLREQIAIVEAPTGVGKTMAYLVPAALYARKQREPVVVSSYTRALQDQILRHEAPRLRRLIHPDLRIAALKGRSNYLCRRRWDLFVSEEGSGPDGRWAVDRLEGWVLATKTGDFAEAPDLRRRAGWVLSRIGGDHRFCRGRLCHPDSGCFHKRARREAREADLVVVNHSLLIADALSGGILPEHRALIVDEAHQLPDAALEPLSLRVSEMGFEETVRLMGGSGEPGVSDRLRRALRRLPSKVAARNLRGKVKAFEEQARGVLAQTRAFFRTLRAGAGFPRGGEKRRYGPRDCTGDLFPQEAELFLHAVEELAQQGRRLLADVVGELPLVDVNREVHDALEAAGALQGELAEQVDILKALLAPEPHGRVYILEDSRSRGAELSSVPLDPGPALREHLLERYTAVVFTSATLAAADDFAYFSGQVGLERGEPNTLQLESPFDLDGQLLTVVPSYAVDPRREGYEAFLGETIERLVTEVGRKTLVLFTSYQTLHAVREDLEARDALGEVHLLVQSKERSRTRLIELFRDADRAVLLGTATFWQGVDFPGRELEMLVVTRLPFPVPTDPRVEAISQELEQEGRSSFQDYALPEAVLRMRQGVGRLIRRSDDRGVCVVLDPRLMRARYGAMFCSALPSAPLPVDSPAELLRRVREWFDS